MTKGDFMPKIMKNGTPSLEIWKNRSFF